MSVPHFKCTHFPSKECVLNRYSVYKIRQFSMKVHLLLEKGVDKVKSTILCKNVGGGASAPAPVLMLLIMQLQIVKDLELNTFCNICILSALMNDFATSDIGRIHEL